MTNCQLYETKGNNGSLQQTGLTLTGANWNPPGESLADSLPCKALHLDVEELSEVTEPFDHLRGHTAVKLHSGQETAGQEVSRVDSKRGEPIKSFNSALVIL